MTVPAPGQDNPHSGAMIEALDSVLVYLSWVPPGHAKDARDAWASANLEAAKLAAALEAAIRSLTEREIELSVERSESRDSVSYWMARAEAATRERDEAKREKDYWIRNYTAQYNGSKLEAAEQSLEAARDALHDVWRSYKLLDADQAHLDHSMEAVEAYLFPAALDASAGEPSE